MGLLDQFAGGLRSVGYMNPSMGPQLMQQDAQAQQQQQAMQRMLAEKAIQGAETGAAPPIGQFGPNIQTQVAQQQLLKAQRDMEISNRISSSPQIKALLESGKPEDIRKAASVYLQNGAPVPAHIKDLMPVYGHLPAGSQPTVDGQPVGPQVPPNPVKPQVLFDPVRGAMERDPVSGVWSPAKTAPVQSPQAEQPQGQVSVAPTVTLQDIQGMPPGPDQQAALAAFRQQQSGPPIMKPTSNTPLTAAGKIAADWAAGRITAEEAKQLRDNANTAPLAGDDLKSAGAQIAAGQPINQVVPGYGRSTAGRKEQARAEAIKQIQEENPSMTAEQAGQELSNRSVARVAQNKSVGQLTTMLGATRQAVSQLDFNIKKVSETMDALPKRDIENLSPLFTAISRGEEKWTGDPKYAALYYYMYAAATESARILSGGVASIAQLHVGAQNEAAKWASANWTTPQQWKEGVSKAMTEEGHARIGTFEQAIKGQTRGGAAPAPIPTSAVIGPGWTIREKK